MIEYRVAELYINQSTTVIAVFSVNVNVIQAVCAGVMYASIEPVSIVICDEQVHKAIDIQAQHIPLKQLCQLVPELQKYL